MTIVAITTVSDADFVHTFIYASDPGAVPVNLTGSSLRMMARHHAADEDVALDMSTSNGNIVITNAAAGQFTLTIPFSKLSRLAAGTYDHSLIRTRPDLILEEMWSGVLTHAIGPTR